MQQIAATRRRDSLLQQTASCDKWKSLLLRQSFVAAIWRTNSNCSDKISAVSLVAAEDEATSRHDALQRFAALSVSALKAEQFLFRTVTCMLALRIL